MVAATDVCARTMLPDAMASTVPPLNVSGLPSLFAVGVAIMVTVAVEPDCNDGRVQLTLEFAETAPQLPAVTLGVMLVKGTCVSVEFKFAVTLMLFARSGPLFVTV